MTTQLPKWTIRQAGTHCLLISLTILTTCFYLVLKFKCRLKRTCINRHSWPSHKRCPRLRLVSSNWHIISCMTDWLSDTFSVLVDISVMVSPGRGFRRLGRTSSDECLIIANRWFVSHRHSRVTHRGFSQTLTQYSVTLHLRWISFIHRYELHECLLVMPRVGSGAL